MKTAIGAARAKRAGGDAEEVARRGPPGQPPPTTPAPRSASTSAAFIPRRSRSTSAGMFAQCR